MRTSAAKILGLVCGVGLALGAAGARAGEILYTDTATGNPVVSIYAPTNAGPYSGSCNSFAGYYDSCNGYFLLPSSFGATATATVQIVDDVTGSSTNYAYSALSSSPHYSDELEDSNDPGYVGVSDLMGFSGTNGPNAVMGFLVDDLQGYPYESSNPCSGLCAGTLTGGVQNLFTFNYYDADNNLLGSDTLAFEGQGGASEPESAPEPASLALMGAGLTALGLARLGWRRSSSK